MCRVPVRLLIIAMTRAARVNLVSGVDRRVLVVYRQDSMGIRSMTLGEIQRQSSSTVVLCARFGMHTFYEPKLFLLVANATSISELTFGKEVRVSIRIFRAGGVAAVAIGAGDALLPVDVVVQNLLGNEQLSFSPSQSVASEWQAAQRISLWGICEPFSSGRNGRRNSGWLSTWRKASG